MEARLESIFVKPEMLRETQHLATSSDEAASLLVTYSAVIS